MELSTADFIWTPEHKATLREMHAEGRTVGQIARAVGAPNRGIVMSQLGVMKLRRLSGGAALAVAPMTAFSKEKAVPATGLSTKRSQIQSWPAGFVASQIPRRVMRPVYPRESASPVRSV